MAILAEQSIHTLIGFVMSGDKSVYFAAKMAGTKIIVAERNAPVMYALRQTRWSVLSCADAWVCKPNHSSVF